MSNVITITPVSPGALADQIGLIKAQIAPQLEKLKELEAALKSAGPGVYSGTTFDATVVDSERDTLDMAAVRAKLSPQFITAHTKTSQVRTLKVVNRVLGRKAS